MTGRFKIIHFKLNTKQANREEKKKLYSGELSHAGSCRAEAMQHNIKENAITEVTSSD